MGERTAIEWTATRNADGTITPGATWNPWRGCTKVSPGCASCYMFSGQKRYGRDPSVVVRAARSTFNTPLRWHRHLAGPHVLGQASQIQGSGFAATLEAGKPEPRHRKFVFTCSWSDWFHEDADPWRDEAWDIIRRTPSLTYQILTKRPERIAGHLPADWGDGWPNVWLGVSVENYRFTWRLDILVNTPARVRFLSAEPLLGPLDLGPWLHTGRCQKVGPAPERFRCGMPAAWEDPGEEHTALIPTGAPWFGKGSALAWVIAGGESGGRAGHPPRPMNLDWARSLRDQCVESRVPFFLKQLGGARPGGPAELDGREWRQMPGVVV